MSFVQLILLRAVALKNLITVRKLMLKPERKSPTVNCLVGLVVKMSASRATDPGLIPALGADRFPRPVVTLPVAWHYRVSAGTGRPSVRILRLGEIASLILTFHLSVVARTLA